MKVYVPQSQYKLQAGDTLSQAAPVQNTWYTVADLSGKLLVLQCAVSVATTAEDLEFKVTVDGNVLNGSQAGAVAGTHYRLTVSHSSTTVYLTAATGIVNVVGSYCALPCKTFKLEVRKTSANGAGTLTGLVNFCEV